MAKLNFQHHSSSLQCHMILQKNHSNMQICCSRNISNYYQCGIQKNSIYVKQTSFVTMLKSLLWLLINIMHPC